MIRRLQELPASQFLITFWVAPTVNRDVLQAYFRALKWAYEALARDPERYMPLWERNVAPALKGAYDWPG